MRPAPRPAGSGRARVGRRRQRHGRRRDARLDLGQDRLLPVRAAGPARRPAPPGSRPRRGRSTERQRSCRVMLSIPERKARARGARPSGRAVRRMASASPRCRSTANRNSQTTSTKCQYQAAASKPTCLFGVKCPASSAQQADEQEDRPDDDVGAVEARRHEEVGAVDVAGEAEGGVAVFVGLEDGEAARPARSPGSGR